MKRGVFEADERKQREEVEHPQGQQQGKSFHQNKHKEEEVSVKGQR